MVVTVRAGDPCGCQKSVMVLTKQVRRGEDYVPPRLLGFARGDGLWSGHLST
jgi:hypothetical protein